MMKNVVVIGMVPRGSSFGDRIWIPEQDGFVISRTMADAELAVSWLRKNSDYELWEVVETIGEELPFSLN
jgi:hypothetical protein